jgi:hypothetical protein
MLYPSNSSLHARLSSRKTKEQGDELNLTAGGAATRQAGQKEPEPAFRPDFIAIPYAVFTDPTLSHAAKLVYGRLKLYAGKDGRCCPKHETLARELCISDRQLRTVLVELHTEGWIEWHRARTSCVYTVSSDRKKTSDLESEDRKKTASEIGRKLPIRSEENCRSRSEENFRQKRSIENHHQKRSIEKKNPAAPAKQSAVAETSEPETQNPVSMKKADDEKPTPRTALQNPEMEFRERMAERHPHLDAQELLALVARELNGVDLTRFLESDGKATTAPQSLKNPAGHYRKLARKVAQAEIMRPLVESAEQAQRAVAEQAKAVESTAPPLNAAGRCSACNGIGYLHYDADLSARKHCTCRMGRDLAAADNGQLKKLAREAAAAPQTPPVAISIESIADMLPVTSTVQ